MTEGRTEAGSVFEFLAAHRRESSFDGRFDEWFTTGTRWRIAPNAARDRVISTVNTEVRLAHETVRRGQDGYTTHVAIEPDTGVITDCVVTEARGAVSWGA